MPQEPPPAKTDSTDHSWQRVDTVQYTADTFTGRWDGPTSNVQGAAPPMHEESKDSRSETVNHCHDIQHCSWECKGLPRGMRPSHRTVWVWALVGSQRSWQAQWPPTPPQSTTQVNPGCTAHNPTGCTYERVSTYTPTCNLRLRTAAFRSETNWPMQQQANTVTPKPLVWCPHMPHSQRRAWRQWNNWRHDLAGRGSWISGQVHSTGPQHGC